MVLVLETIGIWFLENKLVFPEGRLWAARWVIHLSIFTMFVDFTQIPYNASIISHERFDIYAYAEIANFFLRLSAVYLISHRKFLQDGALAARGQGVTMLMNGILVLL